MKDLQKWVAPKSSFERAYRKVFYIRHLARSAWQQGLVSFVWGSKSSIAIRAKKYATGMLLSQCGLGKLGLDRLLVEIESRGIGVLLGVIGQVAADGVLVDVVAADFEVVAVADAVIGVAPLPRGEETRIESILHFRGYGRVLSSKFVVRLKPCR